MISSSQIHKALYLANQIFPGSLSFQISAKEQEQRVFELSLVCQKTNQVQFRVLELSVENGIKALISYLEKLIDEEKEKFYDAY